MNAPLDDDPAPLPLPPLSLPRPALPRRGRWREAALGQLPLVLMALLAGATWWLVQKTPVPASEAVTGPPRHEPDYLMRGFSVQHYTGTGPARGVIEGDVVRHYPDTGSLEIEGVRLQWRDDVGHRLRATAARAETDAQGREVRLAGGASVVREARPDEPGPLEFRGEELVFDRVRDQVRSDRPVILRQGASVIEARALVYDHADGRLELRGAVHGRLPAR